MFDSRGRASDASTCCLSFSRPMIRPTGGNRAAVYLPSNGYASESIIRLGVSASTIVPQLSGAHIGGNTRNNHNTASEQDKYNLLRACEQLLFENYCGVETTQPRSVIAAGLCSQFRL